jgi:DsbC/DsbD-like thiol-disulfide interchange protein/cytochrome c biogenesis protein CcdA
MLMRLLMLLMLLLVPAVAAARENAIQPELIAEGAAVPAEEVELAILMHTRPGWHGYWLNPGDAGLPMDVQWQLPPGFSAGPLRYPVPSRLEVAGLMNYVYERDYALLVRLKVPAGAIGQVPIRAQARWLACTDEVCVPEQGEFSLNLPIRPLGTADARFNGWRQALPRPLVTPARFAAAGDKLRIAIPLPQSVAVRAPYLFPITDDAVDYDAPQSFRRSGDMLVAELQRKGDAPARFAGVLALRDGSGLEFNAVPGAVPEGGTPIGGLGAEAVLWAVLGAIAGGILLNLMPCVFPILALKAVHLSRAGGDVAEARSDALAYTAGAVVGTGVLGAILLAIRAAGAEAGWAFQLQDPRTVMLLLLLSVAITANLLGLFELPVLGGRARPAGGFGTGALAAFVATPCAGPFLGAALGTALLLPAAGAILVFAALGLGLAIPFALVGFVPALRGKLPRPGAWMERLQRFLAIPMGATAVACAWLLYRQAGQKGLVIALIAAAVLAVVLLAIGYGQRRSLRSGWTLALLAVAIVGLALWQVPDRSTLSAARGGAEAWSEDRVAAYVAQGKPVFVYFTADWCLTCKANEAAAIDRDEVRKAFDQAGVKVLAGDWTNGDPPITRFLESRGRAGVPVYLWYAPGKPPEELPQILTPTMLTDRAQLAKR